MEADVHVLCYALLMVHARKEEEEEATYNAAGQIVLAIFIDENNSVLADSFRSIQSPTCIDTDTHTQTQIHNCTISIQVTQTMIAPLELRPSTIINRLNKTDQ